MENSDIVGACCGMIKKKKEKRRSFVRIRRVPREKCGKRFPENAEMDGDDTSGYGAGEPDTL